MKNANAYIADELAHKNKYLHIALHQAQSIISTLEKENNRLRDVLAHLTSINNKDGCVSLEDKNDRLCAV